MPLSQGTLTLTGQAEINASYTKGEATSKGAKGTGKSAIADSILRKSVSRGNQYLYRVITATRTRNIKNLGSPPLYNISLNIICHIY